MPVNVPIVVTDPPSAPAGYLLCAFEVRACQKTRIAGQSLPVPLVIFPGTTDGFESAANALIQALIEALRSDTEPESPQEGAPAKAGSGLRLACVCWWVETPLDQCRDDRMRLVSVYDLARGVWTPWVAEDRASAESQGRAKRARVPRVSGGTESTSTNKLGVTQSQAFAQTCLDTKARKRR